MRRLRSSLLIVAASLLASACMTSTGGSSPACAGPSLSVTPTHVKPGGGVNVTGNWFQEGCRDVGVNGRMQGSTRTMHNIQIILVQESRKWTLASVDAGADASFQVQLRLPTNLSAGNAVIQAIPPGSVDPTLYQKTLSVT